MQYISLICFWPLVLVFVLIKNDLRPLWKWKNAFVMIGMGALAIWFFRSPILRHFHAAMILHFPTDYIPFYDQLSTSLALVIYEEVTKGVMILFLLLMIKLLNPKVSMRWTMVVVPLCVSNLFSLEETINYYQSFMNSTFWSRALFPVHFIFQIPMIFILFKYYRERGKMYQIIIFCGSMCAAIGTHFLWNACMMLDNDLYKYMAANIHYSILYYVCAFVKTMCSILLSIWLIFLGFRIFSCRQPRSCGERYLQKINDFLAEKLKGKACLLPMISAIIAVIFVVFGLSLYFPQKIKPVRMMGECQALRKNNIKAYVDNFHDPEKIDLAALPLVRAIKKKEMKRPRPFNFNLVSICSTGTYQICCYRNKQYLLYEGIVIGLFPIMSKETIEEIYLH